MKKLPVFYFLAIILVSISCKESKEAMRFCGWDYDYMKQVRKEVRDSSSALFTAYRKLIADAEREMTRGPWSVTFKNTIPPGGTKNDYMSYGPYWWPDTTKPDGLPYIRRDGIRNPQSGVDRQQLGNMFDATRNLALAWFFTGDRKYAKRAVYLLKVWFLEPETRMNPNLQFAQGIPGITTGRGIGIIDFRGVYSLVDAISLLKLSDELSNDDFEGIKKWFSDLFVWLTTSDNGHDEDNTRNNHAVSYDIIVSSIARFLGNDEYVVRKTSEMPQRRIEPMIEADGRQPEELVRTKAFGYSVSNLKNFFDAGTIGLKTGVDIFSFKNSKGASIRTALDFLIPFIGMKEKWPWDEIGEWEQTENNLGIIIRTASVIYKDGQYKQIWEEVFRERLKTNWSLLVTTGP